MKKRLFKIGIIIFVIVMLFLGIKYLWLIIPGYYLCNNAEQTSIAVSEITDQNISFSYSIANIGNFYEGYKCEIKDGVMYIGVKTIFLLGKVPADGLTFHVPIDQKIKKIVLMGNGEEKVIYDDSTGQENDNSNFEIASFAPANEETSNFESSSYYSDINSTQEQPSMNYNKLGEYSKKVLESIPDNVVYLKGKNTVIYKQEFERIISEYKMWGYQESEARDLAEQYLKKRESAYYEATRQGFKATDQEVKNIIEQEKTNVEKSDNKQQVYDYLQGLNMSIDQYWNSQFEKIRKEIAIDKYFTKEKEKFSSSSDLEEWKTYKEDLYSKLIKQQNYKTVN